MGATANTSDLPAPAAGNGVARDDSGPAKALKHNPGLSLEWTPEEQAVLDEGLAKYASESSVTRYVKIATQLQDKTVRDVVLRCRWMSKKENGKRRKDDHNHLRKNNKKGGSDPSKSLTHLSARPSGAHIPTPMLPVDNDDDIPFQEIGGPTGHLLEQNAQFSNQISANFASFQIQENIDLLCQMRDNILTIMNDSTSDMPGIMNQMPPLREKVNEELASLILPRAPSQMKS